MGWQREWDERRAAKKDEAAVTVEINRLEALEKLQALRAGAGYPAEPVRNEVGEQEVDIVPDETVSTPSEEIVPEVDTPQGEDTDSNTSTTD